MRNLNQLKVDIDRMRYSTDMGELRKRLSKILKDLTDGVQAEITIDDALDPASANPVENRAIAAALQVISSAIQYIKGSVTDLDALNTMHSLGVYEYIGNGWKGLVSVSFDAQGNVSQIALASSSPSYSGDTLTWISGNPCIIKRVYSDGEWSQWEEVSKKPDDALSDTSENPVQNAVITSALNSIQQTIADTVAEYFLRTVQSEIGEYVSVTMDGDGWLTITALQDIGYDSPAYGIGVALPIGKEIASGSKLQVEGWKDETNTDYTDYLGCTIDFCPYYPDATAEESFTPTLGEAGEPETSEHLFFNDVAANFAVVKWEQMYAGDTICIRLRYTDASSLAARAYNAVQRYYIMSMANQPTGVTVTQDFTNHVLTLTPANTHGMIAIWLGGLVPPSGSVRVRGWLLHRNGTYSIGIYHSDNATAYNDSNVVATLGRDTYNERVEVDWTIEATETYRPDYLIIPTKDVVPVEMLEGRLQMHLFIEGDYLGRHLDALYGLIKNASSEGSIDNITIDPDTGHMIIQMT